MSNIFGQVAKLNVGLDAAWLRNEVISNNLANVDVPGFKRSSVAFEDFYRSALENDGGFTLKKTREKHIDIGESSGPMIRVIQDESTSMRMDGNNVDPEKEMTDLATNVLYYQTLQTKVASEFEQLRTAIKGG